MQTRLRPTELTAEDIDAFLRQSLVGFCVYQEGRLTYANDRLAEVFGYGRQELLHIDPISLVAPEDRPTVRANIAARLSGAQSVLRYSFAALSRQGGRVEMEVHGALVDHDGRPAIASVMLDVTEQRRIERMLGDGERRFRTIINNVRDAVFQTNTAGRWTFLNPAWEDITGFTVDESLGRRLLEFVRPGARDACAEAIDALAGGRCDGVRLEVPFLTSDDGWHWLEMHVQATVDDGGAVAGLTGSLRDIHGDRQVRAALADSEARLRELAEVLAEGVVVVDPFNRITYVNPAATAMLGWRAEELIGNPAHRTIRARAPDGSSSQLDTCPIYRAMVERRRILAPNDHFQCQDGRFLPVSIHAAPIVGEDRLGGAVVAFHDISERQRTIRALEQSEQRYRVLFNGSSDAIFIAELLPSGPGRILEVNDVACRVLGHPRQELIGMPVGEIDAEETAEDMSLVMEKLRRDGMALFERVHRARDGRRIPVEVNAQVIELDGKPAIQSVVRDVTERKKAEQRMFRLAHYDALTGLPNRLLLLDRLNQALEQARRFGRLLAVLFLDLDGFKLVNDRFGHDAGDALLRDMAGRLLGSVRKGDTVSRLGGDEFVMVLPEIATATAAQRVARKIIAAAARPIPWEDTEMNVTGSIGIALYPDHAETAESLLKLADDAMYRAKGAGRNAMATCRGE